ncbi:uncharacterized protein J3D65DRAFT_199156 [Phyllosticta citribraziliensis]|uniref:Secreted protein n=1 Tax=Phyllosticta citribraziliensis TaxID=989973 RepID=A0ABR1M3A0_9PEZI
MTPSPLLSCTVLLGGGGLDLTASSAICCRLWAAATPKHSLRQLGGDPGHGSLESRLMIEGRGRGLQKIRLSIFDCQKRAVSSKILRRRLCIETWSLCNIISRLRSVTQFDERGVGLLWLPWSHVVRAVLKTLAVFCSAHVSLPRKVSTLHLSTLCVDRRGPARLHAMTICRRDKRIRLLRKLACYYSSSFFPLNSRVNRPSDHESNTEPIALVSNLHAAAER